MEILERIGLSRGERKVYEVLLDRGRSSASEIHEKTGIERRNIYDILTKLIEKGLVTYVTENRRRMFRLTHPNKIIGYLEEQQSNLEEVKAEVRGMLAGILEKFETTKPQMTAEVFRGQEGMKAVFEDMLNSKENHIIGGGWYVVKELPHFWRSYNRRRIERKVRWHNLVKHGFKGKQPAGKFVRVKVLPREFGAMPHAVIVYGPKVANLLWRDEFFAFVIENEEIAHNYRGYHKYLWDHVAQ